jgi:cytochrome c oxidase cbb3-type subunit 3
MSQNQNQNGNKNQPGPESQKAKAASAAGSSRSEVQDVHSTSDPDPGFEGGEAHEYDGIRELNHHLPSWWVSLFYLTIIFSGLYFIYYGMGFGPSLREEYLKAQQAAELRAHAAALKEPPASETELRALVKDSAALSLGKSVFALRCVSCHGAAGQGGIGPNLTDDYWIHGGKMTQIVQTITHGVADKGMPPWGPLLKKSEIHGVAAWVKSLRGSHPPQPKAPQGVLEAEE